MSRSATLLGLALLCACDRVTEETPPPAPQLEAPEDVAVVEPEPEPEPVAEAAPKAPPYGLAHLTEAERKAMYTGSGDTTRPTRIHHVTSNESRHDIFFPYIRDRGGAYVGVASDHNYTLIAVAKAKYAFLIDIDNAVVNTHRIYSVFVPLSETPDQLIAYFADDARDSSLALLDEGLSDVSAADRIRTKTTFKVVRRTLYEHLQEMKERTYGGVPTSWVSDPQLYGYIRRMYETDRIRIMPGDLTGENAMSSIAASVEALGEKINVYYESNAAEWFIFHRPYRNNVRGLPVSDDAVLIRTIDTKPARTHHGRSFTPADNRWNYNVHALSDYQEHLSDQYFNRNLMLKVAEREGRLQRETGTVGLSLIEIDPIKPKTRNPLAG